MLIQAAHENDLKDLVALDAQCNHSAWSKAQFQAALHAVHDTILVAKTPSQLLGFIVWQRLFDEIEVHLIATDPTHRRQGIASRLMESLFSEAQRHDIQRILLEVRQSNQAAQAFYLAHGFQNCGLRKWYYGTEHAVLMEKIC